MMAPKRRKRATNQEDAPGWSKQNEKYTEDGGLLIDLEYWRRFDLVNVTRFVPYWWDVGGGSFEPTVYPHA
jgi:hypothetical protein